MGTKPDEVLRFDSVTKRYGNVVAVDNASLTVGRGSFVVFLGPSGCGKTTCLRLIAGFEPPDAGAIYIEGRPTARVPPNRRPVNTVFQDYALFPHMTVFDNIAFGPSLRKTADADIEKRVKAKLELVRLSGMERRRPHELSGGQQQRVALARALINEPTILLLDEPFSNLDYKLRKEMRLELKRIQREVDATFIFVTHDQDEALMLADYIVVMDVGRIQQVGSPSDVYRSPASMFVASFIGTTNFLYGSVAGRFEVQMQVSLDGLATSVLCRDTGSAIGTSVVLSIRAESISVSSKRPEGSLNAIAGKVEETLYLGDHSDLLIRLPNDTAVQCQESYRRGELLRFHPGDDVYVIWSPEESFVFEQRE